jgi:hypothetical protein
VNRKTFMPYGALSSAFLKNKGGARQEIALRPGEPRWPALLAMLTIGGLYYALPYSLTVRPHWLVLILVALLATPAVLVKLTLSTISKEQTRLADLYVVHERQG